MNLERDTGRNDALNGYLITPIVRRSLARIVAGLESGASERAWTLTGPYGSGKTAFTVFLTSLLRGDKSPLRRAAHAVLKESEPVLAHSLRKTALLPVILTGERAPLDVLIIRALRTALENAWATRRGHKPSVLSEVVQLDHSIGNRSGCPTSEVIACIENAARSVTEAFGLGLLLVIDEAGKTLEYAAQNPARGDVHLFQALAELAAGFRDAPLVMITVLHQAFEEYAARLAATQRNEWTKVQGRFTDLIFQDEPDQIVRLVAAALEPARERPRLAGWNELIEGVSAAVSRGTGWDRRLLAKNLDRCWPLHPATAVLLGPLFRGKLAQNERSLFAFLSSGEPLGFDEFLKSQTSTTLYTPDHLYDYVLGALGSTIFGRDGKLWAEIDTALRRLPPEAEAVDAKVLKVSGILSMLGDQVGLRPAKQMITQSLPSEGDAARAIDRLQASSILIYRKFRDAYQIWEGSDLDLESLVKDALSQLPPDQPLGSLLMRLVPPRPLIARRHLFHTGTLRYFEVRFLDEEEFAQAPSLFGQTLSFPNSNDTIKADADGLILLLLPRSEDSGRVFRKQVTDHPVRTEDESDVPVVVVLPSSTVYLGDLARELAALERVQSGTPALQADPIARKEVAARLNELQQLLEQEVARVFSADNSDCMWIGAHGPLLVRSARELMETLSAIFDERYSQAPSIRNELLNRRELSSAAAKARRNLLEAMIVHRDKARLGFTGYPPEVSMYRSVFEESGLHAKVDDRWRFVTPEGKLGGVWREIDRFLEETERQRRSVAELYDRLRRPPFGIKAGPLPVLVCAALLARESEVALYEQGSLVPEFSAPVIERLLRWPERFEVRQARISGVRLEVFERLARSLLSGGRPDKTILDVVRGLVRFLTGLPAYVRNTSNLPAEAMRVRDALLRAREPAQLLFHDLPVACGGRAFELETPADEDEIERFLGTLRRSLGALRGAYTHLLTELEQGLSQALGLPSQGPELRSELRARAKRVFPVAVDTLLRGFLVRASDEAPEHEEWIVSLGSYLASKPPTEWVDRDRDQFSVHLALVSRRFRSLEVMAMGENSREPGTELVRVAVARQGSIEQESVVVVRDNDMGQLALLKERIMNAVEDVSGQVNRDTVVAALALVTERILAEAEAVGSPSAGGHV